MTMLYFLSPDKFLSWRLSPTSFTEMCLVYDGTHQSQAVTFINFIYTLYE
jgi:hypothetical protein